MTLTPKFWQNHLHNYLNFNQQQYIFLISINQFPKFDCIFKLPYNLRKRFFKVNQVKGEYGLYME